MCLTTSVRYTDVSESDRTTVSCMYSLLYSTVYAPAAPIRPAVPQTPKTKEIFSIQYCSQYCTRRRGGQALNKDKRDGAILPRWPGGVCPYNIRVRTWAVATSTYLGSRVYFTGS